MPPYRSKIRGVQHPHRHLYPLFISPSTNPQAYGNAITCRGTHNMQGPSKNLIDASCKPRREAYASAHRLPGIRAGREGSEWWVCCTTSVSGYLVTFWGVPPAWGAVVANNLLQYPHYAQCTQISRLPRSRGDDRWSPVSRWRGCCEAARPNQISGITLGYLTL